MYTDDDQADRRAVSAASTLSGILMSPIEVSSDARAAFTRAQACRQGGRKRESEREGEREGGRRHTRFLADSYGKDCNKKRSCPHFVQSIWVLQSTPETREKEEKEGQGRTEQAPAASL